MIVPLGTLVDTQRGKGRIKGFLYSKDKPTKALVRTRYEGFLTSQSKIPVLHAFELNRVGLRE